MNNEECDFMMKFFVIQNLYFEEQNYIEILKGYCESKLEKSEDLNKIYLLLDLIYNLHIKASKKSEKLISGI